ncbi:hypothetical protein ACLMAL_35890 [Nocardia sp. CWNU-33]|uniref:hypothetical protein n=1 Tax=Nocardia sp. CWNU-33 TaxID=3392117 RepID=UPI00398F352F
MTSIVATAITALGIHVFAFGGLWLRLRWQAKQQHVHRRYVVDYGDPATVAQHVWRYSPSAAAAV